MTSNIHINNLDRLNKMGIVAYLSVVHTLRVDTVIILDICHKYHVKHTCEQLKCNLDRLKSESKEDTNETPTRAVPVHAPQTNALR